MSRQWASTLEEEAGKVRRSSPGQRMFQAMHKKWSEPIFGQHAGARGQQTTRCNPTQHRLCVAGSRGLQRASLRDIINKSMSGMMEASRERESDRVKCGCQTLAPPAVMSGRPVVSWTCLAVTTKSRQKVTSDGLDHQKECGLCVHEFPCPCRQLCPCFFEFLTTLTFGALRRNHFVSTALEPTSKKKQRQGRLRVDMRPAIYYEFVKNTTEVGREVRQRWRRCIGCCVVKTTMLRL